MADGLDDSVPDPADDPEGAAASETPLSPAAGLTRRAGDLQRTGVQLELAAARWRQEGLH
jgi:hypothetical protein